MSNINVSLVPLYCRSVSVVRASVPSPIEAMFRVNVI